MKLFIYGTLKRGHSRASLLRGQQLLGEVRTAARYRLYDTGSYPALVEVTEGREIQGELWQVDAACLATLDEIEGVPRLFRRQSVELMAAGGTRDYVQLAEPRADSVPEVPDDAEAYFYQRTVAGLRDCGSSWK